MRYASTVFLSIARSLQACASPLLSVYGNLFSSGEQMHDCIWLPGSSQSSRLCPWHSTLETECFSGPLCPSGFVPPFWRRSGLPLDQKRLIPYADAYHQRCHLHAKNAEPQPSNWKHLCLLPSQTLEAYTPDKVQTAGTLHPTKLQQSGRLQNGWHMWVSQKPGP